MATTVDVKDFRGRMQRLESLIQGIERSGSNPAAAQAREAIQALLDLHASAFERVLEHVADQGETGQALIARLADDDIVSGLLILYGMHPVDLETRVGQALTKVRPYLRSHGGDVELLSIEGGHVRLRMQGSCHGCASSAQTLKLSIEEAIFERAPDVDQLDVEGVTPPAEATASFVPVEELSLRTGAASHGGNGLK